MKKRLIIFGSIFLVSLTIFIVFLVLIAKTNGLELGVDTFFKNLAYDTRGKKGGFVYLISVLLQKPEINILLQYY